MICRNLVWTIRPCDASPIATCFRACVAVKPTTRYPVLDGGFAQKSIVEGVAGADLRLIHNTL
jgi:hypothetical protein